jgi:hypothetical protein
MHMNFIQLRLDLMGDDEPLGITSNDNPPVDVGPSDDEQGESAVLLIPSSRKAVPLS